MNYIPRMVRVNRNTSIASRLAATCRAIAALFLCSITAPGMAGIVKDQGRIFSTGGTADVTTGTLSQSITAGSAGQLAAIQIQLDAVAPAPAPRLNLSIVASGSALYSEQVNAAETSTDRILTWDIRKANLVFNKGDRFFFTIKASAPGIVIAANDPPGYLRGELYLNGKLLPPGEINDIAFITYIAQPPINPNDPIPQPGQYPEFEPDEELYEEPNDEPEPSADYMGLVIAANDPPGYEGGQLFLNGNPLPAAQRNDLAFITYMIDQAEQPVESQTASTTALRDQGRIFGTDGTIDIGSDTLAQSVTAGMSGQLAAITMQWNDDMPDALPVLNLALLAGADPASWRTLYLQRVNPVTDLAVDSQGVFTWDLTEANLYFEKGDQFTFALSAEPGHTDVQLVSATDIGIMENDPDIFTRDCGYSAQFDGKSIWFFGDTVLRTPNIDDQKLLCNSWSLTYDDEGADGLSGFQPPLDETGASIALIPLTDEEMAFNLLHQGKECQVTPCNARWAIWPGTIAVDEDAMVAYVFYHKVFIEPGDYNFTNVGHSIAIMSRLEGPADRPEFRLYEEYPTLFFSEERDGFGSAAVVVDGLLYVYGCELQADDILKPCRLARVAINEILDRDTWQFYHGQGNWSHELTGATTVFRGNDMMSVFYNEHLSRYVAIYSQPLSTRVMMRTAQAPEGPWSQGLELFEGRESETFMGWIYDALAHPELSRDNGRTMYITYSRHIGLFQTEFRLVAVEAALK